MAKFKNQKSYRSPPTVATSRTFSNFEAMVGWLINKANRQRCDDKNLSQARRTAEYMNNLIDKGINPEAVGYPHA